MSTDINRAVLEVGAQLLGNGRSTSDDEVKAMDEVVYPQASKDLAVLSLALHYTRHNPRSGAEGRERIRALIEL